MTVAFRLFVLTVLVTPLGCASVNSRLRGWLGGDQAEEKKSTLTKFSDNADVLPPVRRQYKRTTKETLSDQAALDARAGSLWAMEGQGAYLFAPNSVRLVGDPLAVQLDGDPKDQLNGKVQVIKKLLAKIEDKQRQASRTPAAAPAAEEGGKAAASDKPDEKKEGEGADLSIKVVPTRIVERTVEGNYRVKGSQDFLVKNREYKVIVTGVVKAEDFSDDGIPSSKLIDPKFDIVSARRHEEL
jgi:flagellar L-ring protein precursor FlgH